MRDSNTFRWMCRTNMLRPVPLYGIHYGKDLLCPNASTQMHYHFSLALTQ